MCGEIPGSRPFSPHTSLFLLCRLSVDVHGEHPMDKVIVVPAIGDVKPIFNRLREYPEYPELFNVEHELMLGQYLPS